MGVPTSQPVDITNPMCLVKKRRTPINIGTSYTPFSFSSHTYLTRLPQASCQPYSHQAHHPSCMLKAPSWPPICFLHASSPNTTSAYTKPHAKTPTYRNQNINLMFDPQTNVLINKNTNINFPYFRFKKRDFVSKYMYFFGIWFRYISIFYF